ncbi:MAG: hypothetical protein ABFC96_15420 [Thermoguttaceae bacterium]
MLEPVLETHATARLIVCERTGRWAVALRRELTGAGVRVWETRTLGECHDELVASPASFLVLEVNGEPSAPLRFVAQHARQFSAARVAIVTDAAGVAYEAVAREAGAVHFLSSPRHAGLLARLACRHLAQVPPPPQGLAERIWSSLPWADRTL